MNIFGGISNIQHFRSINSIDTLVHKVIKPPFLSIIPIQKEETYNKLKYTSHQKTNYIPIDPDKLDKAQETLRLKRSKPITKNTLELCMNLKYNK